MALPACEGPECGSNFQPEKFFTVIKIEIVDVPPHVNEAICSDHKCSTDHGGITPEALQISTYHCDISRAKHRPSRIVEDSSEPQDVEIYHAHQQEDCVEFRICQASRGRQKDLRFSKRLSAKKEDRHHKSQFMPVIVKQEIPDETNAREHVDTGHSAFSCENTTPAVCTPHITSASTPFHAQPVIPHQDTIKTEALTPSEDGEIITSLSRDRLDSHSGEKETELCHGKCSDIRQWYSGGQTDVCNPISGSQSDVKYPIGGDPIEVNNPIGGDQIEVTNPIGGNQSDVIKYPIGGDQIEVNNHIGGDHLDVNGPINQQGNIPVSGYVSRSVIARLRGQSPCCGEKQEIRAIDDCGRNQENLTIGPETESSDGMERNVSSCSNSSVNVVSVSSWGTQTHVYEKNPGFQPIAISEKFKSLANLSYCDEKIQTSIESQTAVSSDNQSDLNLGRNQERHRFNLRSNQGTHRYNLRSNRRTHKFNFRSTCTSNQGTHTCKSTPVNKYYTCSKKSSELYKRPHRGRPKGTFYDKEKDIHSKRAKKSLKRKRTSGLVGQISILQVEVEDRNVHLNKKKHLCNICDKAFSHSSVLRIHIKRSHKRRGDKYCNICCKTFANVYYLRTHQLIHTGEKRYLCSVCGKLFSRFQSLQSHVCECTYVFSTHTGTKRNRHLCYICGKLFYSLCDLLDHESEHRKSPYICNICGRVFAVRDDIRAHIRTHTHGRHITCSICSMTFENMGIFGKHCYKHKCPQLCKMTCNICCKTFKCFDSFRKHWHEHKGRKLTNVTFTLVKY